MAREIGWSNEEILEWQILQAVKQASRFAGAKQQWVRPSDWLPMPAVGSQEQKFVGLASVSNDSNNYFTVTIDVPFTVDWGDGTVTNYSGGTIAEHLYTFSSLPASTLTTDGCRQVFVTAYPQVGNTYTNVTTSNFPPSYPIAIAYQPKWLSTVYNGPSLIGVTNSGDSKTLQEVYIGNTIATNIGFINQFSIKKVTIVKANMTSANQMFLNCNSLVEVNIGYLGLFLSCSQMFSGCSSLVNIPLFDTSSATTANTMFSGCVSIQTIPAFNFSNITSTSSMFSGCDSLMLVPALDLSKVTTTINMFLNCLSLVSVGALTTTTLLTSCVTMFSGCFSLKDVSIFTTSFVTSMSGMFSNCRALVVCPNFVTTSLTNASAMFNGCQSLIQVPAFNLSAISSTGNINLFVGNNVISSSKVTGLRFGHSYTTMPLGRTELVEIFNNLGTASGAQTIVITNCLGAAALTAPERAIATGKGWTITG